ncbi:hypothetical protein [Spiroplasma culicicola]|uniref:Colicin V production protein n=1 Tax=Spiroplasma culicicola AES-1 TaxID=1276246 RepID=W6A7Y3_9MOLU|nr:hypothetical protein [Spiroplasma culicicola]AHI53102.1 hypothetical protein SCULI_v1c07610 [Spiroplasma culicicola AES-1]
MIINIGPWWLYDIIAVSVIIGSVMFGLRRGFFMTFYILALELVAVILMMFIPTLLTNATSAPVMKLMNKIGISDVFDEVGKGIGDLFTSILTNLFGVSQEELGEISWGNIGSEFLKVLVALGLYIIFCFLIFVIVNLVGFILYRGLRAKMRRMRIVGSADMMLGAFNGFALGMTFAMILSTVFSLPVLGFEHQRIGVLDFSRLSEEEQVEWAKNGNSFKRYAISRKVTTDIPVLPVVKYMYTNACVQTYLLDPVITIANQAMNNSNEEGGGLQNIPYSVYDAFSTTMLKGYSTNNPFKAPVATCIELMPEDSRSVFRLMAEAMLVAPKLIKNNPIGETNKDTNNSVELMNSLQAYMDERAAQGNGFEYYNQKEFVNWWNWVSSTNSYKNPLWDQSVQIGLVAEGEADRELELILREAERTYSYLRNLHFVNSIATNNPDIPTFIPSFYTTKYILDGLEISPTGSVLSPIFNQYTLEHWNLLDENVRERITNGNPNNSKDYNGYWMGYYFDFARLDV